MPARPTQGPTTREVFTHHCIGLLAYVTRQRHFLPPLPGPTNPICRLVVTWFLDIHRQTPIRLPHPFAFSVTITPFSGVRATSQLRLSRDPERPRNVFVTWATSHRRRTAVVIGLHRGSLARPAKLHRTLLHFVVSPFFLLQCACDVLAVACT